MRASGPARACIPAFALLVSVPTGSSADRQVVTRPEIEAAGVVRLGEILRLPLGWDVITRDGYRWIAVPPGTRALEEPVAVRIDGLDARTGRLGIDDLNRVPLSIAEIDSIIFLGASEPGGPAVTVHTRATGGGPGGGLRAATGGESGDPGPFAYVEPDARNVDRIGHDGTFLAGARPGGVSVDATLTDQVLVGTDPAHARRWRIVEPDEPPHVDSRGYGVRGLGRVGPVAFRARATTLRARDLLFLDVLGRELPAESARDAGALRMWTPGDRDRGLSIALTHATNTLEARSGADSVPLDWRLEETALEARAHARLPDGTLRLGAHLERRAARARGTALDAARLVIYGLDASLTRERGRLGWRAALSASAAGEVEGPSLAATLRAAVAGVGGGRLLATLALTRRPFGLEHDVWPWIRRGLAPALGPHASVVPGASPGATRGGRLDVEWEGRVARTSALSVGGYARRISGASQDTFAYRYDPESERFLSPALLATSQEATLIGAWWRLRATLPGEWGALVLAHRVEHVARGDRAIVRALERTARHVGDARLDLRAERALTLTVRAAARSAVTWEDYAALGEGAAGRYAARVPGAVRVDAIVTKWLAERRASLSLRLENLGGVAWRSDPIGPTTRFGAFAIASLVL